MAHGHGVTLFCHTLIVILINRAGTDPCYWYPDNLLA